MARTESRSPSRGQRSCLCWMRQPSSLRFCSNTADGHRGRSPPNGKPQLGPRWADPAFKGQGQGGVWPEMQKRSKRRPKEDKTIVTAIVIKKNGLPDAWGDAALAGPCAKQAAGPGLGRERAAGRAQGHDAEGGRDSDPGPKATAALTCPPGSHRARWSRQPLEMTVSPLGLKSKQLILSERRRPWRRGSPQHAVGQLGGGGCLRRRRRRRRARAGPGERAGCRGADRGAGAAPAAGGERPAVGTPPPLLLLLKQHSSARTVGPCRPFSLTVASGQPARRRLIVSAILGRQAEAQGEEPHRGASREKGAGR